MWLMQKNGDHFWDVGFYSPQGDWVVIFEYHTSSSYTNKQNATDKIHYLNGGK